MRLESMRSKLLGLLSLKYAVAVALVLVLAFGGALGATRNSLDGIQLVQECVDDEPVGDERDEGELGELANSPACPPGYPPEFDVDEDAEEAAGEEGEGAEAEEGEGAEAEEGEEGDEGPGPGDNVTLDTLPANTTFDATVRDSEGNEFDVGPLTSDADGNVTFAIPAGAASGDATLALAPTAGPGVGTGPTSRDFDIATAIVESGMVSLSIGAAILLALGGVLFVVVRRRRAGTVA